MPSHSHSTIGSWGNTWYMTYNRDGDHSNERNQGTSNSGSAGGNQPHNNMPPFYVLTYIMKL